MCEISFKNSDSRASMGSRFDVLAKGVDFHGLDIAALIIALVRFLVVSRIGGCLMRIGSEDRTGSVFAPRPVKPGFSDSGFQPRLWPVVCDEIHLATCRTRAASLPKPPERGNASITFLVFIRRLSAM